MFMHNLFFTYIEVQIEALRSPLLVGWACKTNLPSINPSGANSWNIGSELIGLVVSSSRIYRASPTLVVVVALVFIVDVIYSGLPRLSLMPCTM